MSEEKIEWRDAWKKLIDASREMILAGEINNTQRNWFMDIFRKGSK